MAAKINALGQGWEFDPIVDEAVVFSFRVPDQYRGEFFRVWAVWQGTEAPAGPTDDVTWLAAMYIVGCDEWTVAMVIPNATIYGTGEIASIVTLYCTELVTLGPEGGLPVDVAAPGDNVRCLFWRNPTGSVGPDDYAHDAILWGVRVKMA